MPENLEVREKVSNFAPLFGLTADSRRVAVHVELERQTI